MSNKKNRFSAKGYYIALVLCAAAIGVSAYLYYRGGNEKTADVPAAAIGEQTPISAAATKPASEQGSTVPEVAFRKPPMIRSVVVLPQPEGPSSVRNSWSLK